ncbi:hypothetical protein [Sorangium sp. So ce1335]|uniref:hypothetical protein n=1 Tax=Sorangium sp. So ce1335 TaxID=3133335 RepID=UPI003F615CC5
MVSLTPLPRLETALYWSARPAADSEFTPEDPLALDYLAQQVGLWLFPALTTRTNRPQNYAVVLYGLHLAERAMAQHELPPDDDTRTRLFEQWERFWALAVTEFRDGALERGDPDAMRGVLGVKRAWTRGERPLRLDYALISRQSELGGLGAYLSSLRATGLVLPGTLRPSPVARGILEAFWDEPDSGARIGSYEAYAIAALHPDRRTIERKHAGITLASLGERSRLSCLCERHRGPQQARLYDVLFGQARDPITLPLSELIRRAADDGVLDPEAVLDTALAGRWGELSSTLLDHLVLARAFGRASREVLSRLNAAYDAATSAGWIAPRQRVAEAAFPAAASSSLQRACAELLDAPLAPRLRSLPMHGGAFLQLVTRLRDASTDDALAHLLAYHRRVQHDRHHGGGWLREDGGKIVVDLTTYTGHRAQVPFPPLKIPVVQRLLADLGRLA